VPDLPRQSYDGATIPKANDTQELDGCNQQTTLAVPISVLWLKLRPYLLLAILTLLCLLPFAGEAFHADDPLSLWTAQHITQRPFDPFGFRVSWALSDAPMWEVTKNPPLASYYAALAGSLAGWSEKALHLAFLLPAVTVILGTYRLAQRFTRLPLIAALATLLTPGFLVSSTSVMCDITMLALWIMAIIFWLEGFDPIKPSFLVISALLIGACGLTKYFGVTLIPLLLAYSMERRRRIERWLWYLLIPVCMFAGYECWAHARYGTGLLSEAARYALDHQAGSALSNMLIALAFAGGCAISALTLAPLIWKWKWVLTGGMLGGVVAVASGNGWIRLPALPGAHDRWTWISCQLAGFVIGGLSILAIAIAEWRQRKDSDSFLLALWVLGTFLFAAVVNWTINARSVLPLVPAAGILSARGLQALESSKRSISKITVALVLAGLVALWVTWGDAELANSARTAAALIHERTGYGSGRQFFQGHWGFQYYMQEFGFIPYDARTYQVRPQDLMVIPENNTDIAAVPESVVTSQRTIKQEVRCGATTMSGPLGAGFYFAGWGPLPFAFGTVPAERYFLLELAPSKHR
jgi:hypothetical protein